MEPRRHARMAQQVKSRICQDLFLELLNQGTAVSWFCCSEQGHVQTSDMSDVGFSVQHF